MKLIKMKIKRNQTAERTRYVYPKGYDATKVRFGPVYESFLPENYDEVVARGNTDEFILIGVSDADAPGFLADPDAKELTYEEAAALGGAWTKQIEKITDPGKVIAIAAKVVKGEALTQEEKEALDPDSPVSGINKSRSFKESLDEFLASGK